MRDYDDGFEYARPPKEPFKVDSGLREILWTLAAIVFAVLVGAVIGLVVK